MVLFRIGGDEGARAGARAGELTRFAFFLSSSEFELESVGDVLEERSELLFFFFVSSAPSCCSCSSCSCACCAGSRGFVFVEGSSIGVSGREEEEALEEAELIEDGRVSPDGRGCL